MSTTTPRRLPRLAAFAVVLGLLVVALVGLTPTLRAADDAPPGSVQAIPMPQWPEGVVETFREVPVQDGGRVKPLATYARYALLRQNGRMSYRTDEDVRRTPTEWLLETLLTPEYAVTQRTFQVQNDEVLDAIGLDHAGRKKRDRYSFRELQPARERLLAKYQEYTNIPAADRSPVEAQVVGLASAYFEFESLLQKLDPLRALYPIGDAPELQEMFPGRTTIRYSEVVRNMKRIGHLWGKAQQGEGASEASLPAFEALVRSIADHSSAPRALVLFPPEVDAETEPEWFAVPDLVGVALRTPYPVDRTADAVAALEGVLDHRADPVQLEAHANEYKKIVAELAERRDEYDTVPLEVAYHQGDWFFRAQWLFVLGFIFAGLGWLFPRRKWTGVAMWLLSGSGLLLVTIGIVQRCIIRERPPVSTLYETILFITGTAVLAALVTEAINRRRIALAVSTFLGALGMFLAYRFEMHEAQDTMPSLVAVLDTNFWLATHVTTVTIGYSAGLFASAMGHVYLLGKMLAGRSPTPVPSAGGEPPWFRQPGTFKAISRMTYGLVCFCLLFSTVGTILGGIWANDSWGRFWGWDPKENGALMICLWMAIILHARMGGYVRDKGIAVLCILGGLVVGFSWWGVNLLGIGLHTYGFTSGAAFGLMVFYAIDVAFLSAVGLHHLATARTAGT